MLDCIVPAAGLSTRMGGKKLTALLGGKPLITHAVTHALASCSRVIVVLGHDSDAVQDVLARTWENEPRLRYVSNPDYRRGMITSIARGALEVKSEWFFVAPADMPFLKSDLYQFILNSVPHKNDGVAALFPEYGGKPAHPTVVNTAVREDFARAVSPGPGSGDLPSMRRYLQSMKTRTVPVSDGGSIIDIDTPEAFTRYDARAGESL